MPFLQIILGKGAIGAAGDKADAATAAFVLTTTRECLPLVIWL
jgi:hypothetical protein